MINATHIISLSEHDDTEDNFGRLSMWRAYGGKTGVALVLNPQIFRSETDAMGVYSAPVNYHDVNSFVPWFEGWSDRLIANQDIMKSNGNEELKNWFFHIFRMFVLTTKHPGFAEEREWRVFHTVGIDEQSPFVSYEVETISGAPQHVVKVQLRDDHELGVEGADPSKLIDRVIIGPCESPLPIRNALMDSMMQAGVENYQDKIWMSFIPLRQPQ